MIRFNWNSTTMRTNQKRKRIVFSSLPSLSSSGIRESTWNEFFPTSFYLFIYFFLASYGAQAHWNSTFENRVWAHMSWIHVSWVLSLNSWMRRYMLGLRWDWLTHAATWSDWWLYTSIRRSQSMWACINFSRKWIDFK